PRKPKPTTPAAIHQPADANRHELPPADWCPEDGAEYDGREYTDGPAPEFPRVSLADFVSGLKVLLSRMRAANPHKVKMRTKGVDVEATGAVQQANLFAELLGLRPPGFRNRAGELFSREAAQKELEQLLGEAEAERERQLSGGGQSIPTDDREPIGAQQG